MHIDDRCFARHRHAFLQRANTEFGGDRRDTGTRELDTVAADPARLLLRARGPIEILVEYALAPAAAGCAVEAEVSIRPSDGRFGRLAARATGLLLATGTLEHALGRMAREAESLPATVRA